MKPGAALAFAHGLNVHFNLLDPRSDIDVFMIAPKGFPATRVRGEYKKGGGNPATRGRQPEPLGQCAGNRALLRLGQLAARRSGVIKDDLQGEECETDLFGEQVVLCGGLVELIKAGFETLVEAGYAPEDGLFRVPARSEADRRPHL